MIIIKVLLYLVIWFFILFALGFCITHLMTLYKYYIRWIKDIKRQNYYTKMKFSFIRKLYLVNPSRWDKDSWWTPTPLPTFFYKTYNETGTHYIRHNYIYTSYLDYLKLYFTLKHHNFITKCRKIKDTENSTLKDILESSQNDINKLKEKSKEEIETAKKINEEVKERLYTSYELLGDPKVSSTFIKKNGKLYKRQRYDLENEEVIYKYKEVEK